MVTSSRRDFRPGGAWWCLGWFVAAFFASGPAWANSVGSDWDVPESATSPRHVSEAGVLEMGCLEAKAYAAEKNHPEDAATCFGKDQGATWVKVSTDATEFQQAVSEYYASNNLTAPDASCSAPASEPAGVKAAKDKVAVAETELAAAQKDAEDKNDTAERAKLAATEQKALVLAAVNKIRKAEEIQRLQDRLVALEDDQRKAANALSAAQAAVAAAKQSLDDARVAARDAAVAAKKLAHSNALTKLDAMHADVVAALKVHRDPAEFEAMVEAYEQAKPDDRSKTQLGVCKSIRQRRLDALGAIAAQRKARAEAAEAKANAVQAHRTDLFRKAESTASGALSGNGLAEQPGSPDKMIFSLMTALGADSKTTGSQVVLTLNLASLFVADEAERLKLDATLRNLTLRANLPLSATDSVPQAGSANPTNSSSQPAGTQDTLSRFTAVLGSSLLDDTDTRLDVHASCYDGVLAYHPFSPTPDGGEQDAADRHDYYDVCNRRAANANRLSWRLGAGFASPAGSKSGDVKTELLAGALVWAPNSKVYTNLFYQRILQPVKVHVLGAGLSVGGNVGGKPSGVDSWARFTLDLLTLYARTERTPTNDPVGDLEVRITPTFRGRILGNSVALIGVGPRLLGRDVDHPSVLATFSLAYDADSLIDQALTTPAIAPSGT